MWLGSSAAHVAAWFASELNTQPTCTPVYASPNTSRCATRNSGPSGSLLLSRRTLSFPASCPFIPAHFICDYALLHRPRISLVRHFPVHPTASPTPPLAPR